MDFLGAKFANISLPLTERLGKQVQRRAAHKKELMHWMDKIYHGPVGRWLANRSS